MRISFEATTGQVLPLPFTFKGGTLRLAETEIRFMLNRFGGKGQGIDIEEGR